MKILLVEDDLISLQIMEALLQKQGHEVTACLNAEVAWQFYQQEPYPLVFSDWLLPEMDGLSLCRKIRKHPKGQQTLIVIITVRQGAEYLKQILDAGADDYLAKPLDIDLFIVRLTVIERQVKNLLLRAQSEKNLAAAFSEIEKSYDDMLGILNHLRIGTAMISKDGKIVFISTVAQQLCGQKEMDLLGQHWSKIFAFSKLNLKSLEDLVRKSIEKKEKFSLELLLPNKQISYLDIETQNYPEEEKKILIFYDMSEVQHFKKITKDYSSIFHNIVGKSWQIRSVFTQIEELANLETTVLIEGETGSGKELAARAIHSASKRSKKPFIAVNCAGLTESILVSQLFGHKRGAFTSAVNDQIGFFEAANGGTLFLDEIGEISPNIQVSLLRVLEEKEITRLGEIKPRKVDVRILAATNQDLSKLVSNGSFRADLFYRIKVTCLQLPPLRERLKDIPLLIDFFLTQCQKTIGKKVFSISKEAFQKLLEYPWPGNVRELKNTIQQAVLKAKTDIIEITDLPIEISQLPDTAKILSLDEEKQRLLAAIETAKGNRTLAARLLGLSRATFYRRLKEFNIPTN